MGEKPKTERKTRPAVLQVRDVLNPKQWRDLGTGTFPELRTWALDTGDIGKQYRIVRPLSDVFSIAETKTRTFAGVAEAADDTPPTEDA